MIAATSCKLEAKRWRNAPNHCQLLKAHVSEIWLLSLLSICRILMRQVSTWPRAQTQKVNIFKKPKMRIRLRCAHALSQTHCNSDFIRILFMRAGQVTADARGAFFWIPFSASRWGTCVNTAGEPLEQRPAQWVGTAMTCNTEKLEC